MTNQTLLTSLGIAILGLGFTLLAYSDVESNNGGHVFAKASALTTYERGPMKSIFLLTAEQTEGRYSMVSEVFSEGMSSYPGHTHKYHSEVFYITAGTIEATVNGETQTLGAGDLLYIPPNSKHAIKVVGKDDVHALMVYEPAGYEKNYMRRRALSEEERRNPETMRWLMELADVHLDRKPAE